MTVSVRQDAASAAAMIDVSGRLSRASALASVDEAYAAGLLQRGQDRIITIDRGTALYEIDLRALEAIQARVLAHENEGGAHLPYRAALIGIEPLHFGLIELYCALWTVSGLEGVVYRRCIDEAAARLFLSMPDDLAEKAAG